MTHQMEKKRLGRTAAADHPQYVVTKEGVYLFVVQIKIASGPKIKQNFTAQVLIDMKSDYGYLSAVDWPLLPVISHY